MLPPLLDDPLPTETEEPLLAVLADEAVGVGVAVAELELAVADGVLAALPVEVEPPEVPVEVAVEVAARWTCAACPTNRPRLAAPAVITTATANRARLRMSFMG